MIKGYVTFLPFIITGSCKVYGLYNTNVSKWKKEEEEEEEEEKGS